MSTLEFSAYDNKFDSTYNIPEMQKTHKKPTCW